MFERQVIILAGKLRFVSCLQTFMSLRYMYGTLTKDALNSFCCVFSQQVPFGPLAFMPGKLVHTNELTVLLGDNWFAKCSAKQADALVEHRKTRESLFF